MKRTIRSLGALFLAAVITVSVAAVGSFAANIKLNRSTVTVAKGYSVTLKAEGTDKTVKWSSSDSKIAAVSSAGRVTGKSVGTANITAKVGGSTLKCKVKVVNAVISSNKSVVSIDKGESTVIKITANGDKSLSVSSETKGIASVKFGKWVGDTVKLRITGKSEGKTVLKINSKKYPEAVKYITVTVKGEDSPDISKMSYAEQVLYYCNIEREKAGLNKLVLDETLCGISQTRADELEESFSHERPDGTKWTVLLKNANYDYKGYTAENIAWGQKTAEEVVKAWMDSPKHKKNILCKDYTRMGVGKNGTYWSQNFTD